MVPRAVVNRVGLVDRDGKTCLAKINLSGPYGRFAERQSQKSAVQREIPIPLAVYGASTLMSSLDC